MGWKDPEPGTQRVAPCACFVVSPSPFTLQVRSQKHKVKMLCQIQADRTSAPKASTSLWAAPCLPSPPLGPLSGWSLQGRAIQAWDRGRCWHHPHSPGFGLGWPRGSSVEARHQAWLAPTWALHHTSVPPREGETEIH